MPVIPMMLVFVGGILIFCGITDRNPIDTVKMALTEGKIPDKGTQTPKDDTFKPALPPGYNPFGPGGTETPYNQQHPTGPIV